MHGALTLSHQKRLSHATLMIPVQLGGHLNNEAPVVCRKSAKPARSKLEGGSAICTCCMFLSQHHSKPSKVSALSSLAFQRWVTAILALDHVDCQVDLAQSWMGSVIQAQLLVQVSNASCIGPMPILVGHFHEKQPPNGVLENSQVATVH